MKTAFEAWEYDHDITFSDVEGIERMRLQGLLHREAKLLYRVEADTWEEAMAVHHIKLGFEPYVPTGPAVDCPHDCGAKYYPNSTGVCPNCGPIDYDLRPEPEED